MFQSASARHMTSTASFSKPGFCNSLLVLRMTCCNQLLITLPQLQAFQNQGSVTVFFNRWHVSICFCSYGFDCKLFKTRVLQRLDGLTGDVLQSSSAHMTSTASFLKPGFCNKLILFYWWHVSISFCSYGLHCMHFETRVLQQLNGFTGDVFQSAPALAGPAARF
jgi:hypothetical protein